MDLQSLFSKMLSQHLSPEGEFSDASCSDPAPDGGKKKEDLLGRKITCLARGNLSSFREKIFEFLREQLKKKNLYPRPVSVPLGDEDAEFLLKLYGLLKERQENLNHLINEARYLLHDLGPIHVGFNHPEVLILPAGPLIERKERRWISIYADPAAMLADFCRALEVAESVFLVRLCDFLIRIRGCEQL